MKKGTLLPISRLFWGELQLSTALYFVLLALALGCSETESGGDTADSGVTSRFGESSPDANGFWNDGSNDDKDGNPFSYECEIGDEEECTTSCGTLGMRKCGKTWGPCEPPPEVCNGIDDDCDDLIDEEGGTNACGGCDEVPEEICDEIDNDCDGEVDEGVTNACGGCGPLEEEECNGIDDDCDGQVDEECTCTLTLDLSGDCLSIECPEECPYPAQCNIEMEGDDPKGCVASQPDKSEIYFQEGDHCGAGSVTGTLTCSSVVGSGLHADNCSINKPETFYPDNASGCPELLH